MKRLEQALGAIHVEQRILILGLGKSRADVDVLRGLHVERDALDRLQRPVQPAHSASTPSPVVLTMRPRCLGESGINEGPSDSPEPGLRAFLVGPHEAAITGDIRRLTYDCIMNSRRLTANSAVQCPSTEASANSTHFQAVVWVTRYRNRLSPTCPLSPR